jgi:hypothetical protein
VASNIVSALVLLEMLHEGVGAGINLGYMAVFPPNHVGRRSVVTQHLEDLTIALRLTQMMSPDHEAVTGTSSQYWFAR